MVVSAVSLPKFDPSGPRVPLIVWPDAVMKTLLSLNGPQGVWPAARFAGLLRNRQSAGLPGLASSSTKKMMRLIAHIADVEHGVISETMLDRKHVFLGIGNLVVGR